MWLTLTARVAQFLTAIDNNPATLDRASVTDRTTWSTLHEAIEVYHANTADLAGIGFVFTEQDPFVGFDLQESCEIDTGNLTWLAHDVVDRFGTYTEVSPCGTGIKIVATMDTAFRTKRRADPEIQVHLASHFFPITGRTIDGNMKIRDVTQEIPEIEDPYFDSNPS